MMALRTLVLIGMSCLAGASVLSSQADTAANPIRKIVTLLQDMQKEIASEGEKEKELYDAYMCYCKTTNEDLAKAADEASAKISETSAKIEEDDASKTGIDQELAQHKADRSSATNDLAKATGIRSKEEAEFAESDADVKANIAAMAGAIPALEEGMGGAAFIQKSPGAADRLKKVVASSNSVNSFDRENVMAFLENRANGDYVPQSGQIVGILKSMKEDMEKMQASDAQEEVAAASGFADLKAAKSKEIEVASAAIETKTAQSGELAVLVAQAKSALGDSEGELADTQKYIAALKISCEEQQKAWTARQSARAEEVSAISEAITILNDDDALDVFKKALPSASFAQSPATYAFLQARTQKSPIEKAHMILSGTAAMFKSQELALISYSLKSALKLKTKATGVPEMIDGMVTLLKKEGEDDAKQKEYCDGELDKSAAEQASASEALSAQQAAISELKDQVATLGSDISTLTLEITALDGSVAEATNARKKENAEYTEAMTMNEAATQLIEKARQRLYKFYNPVLYKEPPKKELTMEEKIYADHGHSDWNEASAFVQVRAHKNADGVAPPPPPATFDAYTKKGDKNTGVVALMDMLSADLKKDMETAESEEKLAQQEYEALMADSATTRAQKAKSATDKGASKATLEIKLEEAKESSELTAEQVEQIKHTIVNLHSSCDFILENFDLRKEARTNEMESLKNAKAVLLGAQ